MSFSRLCLVESSGDKQNLSCVPLRPLLCPVALCPPKWSEYACSPTEVVEQSEAVALEDGQAGEAGGSGDRGVGRRAMGSPASEGDQAASEPVGECQGVEDGGHCLCCGHWAALPEGGKTNLDHAA